MRSALAIALVAAILTIPLVVPAQSLPRLPGSPPVEDDCGTGADAPRGSDGMPIPLPFTCSGALMERNNEDAYLFTIPEGALLLLRAHLEASRALTVQIGPPNGGALALYTEGEVIDEAVLLSPGDYRLQVMDVRSSGTRAYTFTLTAEVPDTTNDCGDGDATPEGRALPGPTTCTGGLDEGDDYDVFQFPADGLRAYRIKVASSPSGHAAYFSIFGGTAGWPALHYLGGAPTRSPGDGALLSEAGTPREWILFVYRDVTTSSTARIPYTLSIAEEPLETGNDCGSAIDLPTPSGEAPMPFTLAEGALCEGAIAAGDPGDAVNLALPASPARLVVEVDTPRQAPFLLLSFSGPGWVGGDYTFGAGPRTATVYTSGHEDHVTAGVGWFGTFNYTLRYQVLPDDQDDCGAGHDAPGLRGHPVTIPAGAPCISRFAPGDSADYFRIDSAPGDMVALRWEGVNPGPFLDADTFEDETSEWRDLSWRNEVAREADGPTVFSTTGWGPGEYTLNLTHIPAASLNDCGSGHDANAGRGLAVPIAVGVPCEAEISTVADRSDDYTVRLAGNDEIILRLTTPPSGPLMRATLRHPSGEAYAMHWLTVVADPVTGERLQTLVGSASDAGTYTLALSADAGTPYTMTLDGPLTTVADGSP